jgi:malate synthase
VRAILGEEMDRIHKQVGDQVWSAGRPDETQAVFERIALADDLPDFLTLVAYDKLPS